MADDRRQSEFVRLPGTILHAYVVPLHHDDQLAGELLMFKTHTLTRVARMWRETCARMVQVF